jgi:hypothetical protein
MELNRLDQRAPITSLASRQPDISASADRAAFDPTATNLLSVAESLEARRASKRSTGLLMAEFTRLIIAAPLARFVFLLR